MIYYFLLAVSIILAVCKSSLYNLYAKRNIAGLGATFRFNAVSYGVAAAIALIGMLVFKESLSPITVICAFFYAMIVLSLQTVSITAMSVGTMSVTAICVMYGMIIPSVAGPIFWQEQIGVLQIPGIILMILSLWFLRGESSADDRKMTKKWVLLALVAFVLSGMAGVMEKIHQSTSGREERMTFVCTACLFMFVFSLIAGRIVGKKRDGGSGSQVPALAIVSGIVIGFYSTVNLILAGKLDSMIYYPIANGGAMILTVLVSAAVFGERFNKVKVIGVVLGVMGILLLSMPV